MTHSDVRHVRRFEVEAQRTDGGAMAVLEIVVLDDNARPAPDRDVVIAVHYPVVADHHVRAVITSNLLSETTHKSQATGK